MEPAVPRVLGYASAPSAVWSENLLSLQERR